MTTILQFSFPPVQIAFTQGVLWSSRCSCLLIDWVARPCTGLCSSAFPQKWLHDSSFPALSCQIHSFGLRVSMFVHALLIVLVMEEALHDRYAIVFVRGIQVIFGSFEFFFDSSEFSIASAPLSIPSMVKSSIPGTYMKYRLLNSLLCLLLNLVGDALQHTATATKSFALWFLRHCTVAIQQRSHNKPV